ncbi:MAG: lamin tail domain-containing protein [bacterium]|nr:lamin tail domain-containing protein [bacterium]
MKTKTIFISTFVFLYAFFHIPIARASIVLSEIQIQGDVAADEFIELYNNGSEEQNLKDFKLATVNTADNSIKDSIKSFSGTSFILSPGQYYLWANSNGEFGPFADTSTTGSLTKGKTFGLFYKSVLQDSFSWDENLRPNMSALRSISTWSFTNTPAPTNSKGEVYKKRIPCSEKMKGDSVRLNELFPNPKNEDDEFIELYNTTDEEILLKSWKVKDKVKTYSFSADTDIIGAKSYLALEKSQTGIELNNSDERVTLIDGSEKTVDETCYENTKEGVSLNYVPGVWRGGTPTPGAANILNNLPETKEKVPKKGYHGVAVDFDARGKDSDHDSLKYTWDFGDGHKSYKEETSHTYEENGTYAVTLKTNDGKEDVVETFTLEIQSYKAPEVRITSLMANPAGSDTDNEWIILENREKKTVNLKGFGVATGWKKLSNHPIREDFFIGPKAEAKLTRAFSLFTLPNQKGKIELRAPDGKVLQEIKYKLEKSIAENTVYQKKKGQKWKFEESLVKDVSPPDTPAEVDKETNDDALVLGVSDIVQDKSTEPEAENVPNQTKEYIENQLSLDPDRPLPQDILAYGTRVKVPDTITLTPISAQEIAPLPEMERPSLTLAERLASQINASLNGLLNDSQEK